MGCMRNAYRILFGEPKHRWEDDIKMDHRETGFESVSWIQLLQDWMQWHAFINIF
jgi:hypothetical protein